MHYFHNFCRLLRALPPDPHRGSAPVNTAGQFILQYFTMEQRLVQHLCTQYCFTGVADKEISQGKLFILSGKVRENEFCKVVGTLEERQGRGSDGRKGKEAEREGPEREGERREGEGPHDPLAWGPQCLNPALRGLAMRILSVRLSVRRVIPEKMEERSVQIFIPYERTFSLVPTIARGCQLLLITNMKSHAGFSLVPIPMALNDLERHNSPYFAFFTKFDSFAGRLYHSG